MLSDGSGDRDEKREMAGRTWARSSRSLMLLQLLGLGLGGCSSSSWWGEGSRSGRGE